MTYSDESRFMASDVIHNVNQHDDQSPWYYKSVVWLMGLYMECVFTTEEINNARKGKEELAKVMLGIIEGDWNKNDPNNPPLLKNLYDASDGEISRLDAGLDWDTMYRLYMGSVDKLSSCQAVNL